MILAAALSDATSDLYKQPQVIGAMIAALVALAALCVNTWMARLQYLHNRNQLAEQKRKERRDSLKSQLDGFYGPLQYHLMATKALFQIFRSNKPKGFRTLTYLLAPDQLYDINNAQSQVQLTAADKQLLSEILDVGTKVESLILEKAGLVDDKGLMSQYVPNSQITDVNPEAFKGMGLLPIAMIHFRVLRLAFEGKLSSELNSYKDFIYPRELDAYVERHIEKLRSELASLSS
jgi:heme exporter protein D